MGASKSVLAYPDVDLSGKVAIVTGGNTGIGYETAKGLTRMGAHTFITCRSLEKGKAAIEKLIAELSPPAKDKDDVDGTKSNDGGVSESGAKVSEADDSGASAHESKVKDGGASSGEVEKEAKEKGNMVEEKDDQSSSPSTAPKEIKVECIPLNLASFQSINEFVRLFKERNLPLHILVNNAGVFALPYNKTADGFEEQYQVNHLGPMLLTLEFLPLLLDTTSSSDGRIIFISATAHYQADPFEIDSILPVEEDYDRIATYNNTKKFNVMMGYALQRKLHELEEDHSITVSSVSPGFVKTESVRGLEDRKLMKFIHETASLIVGRTPEQGAATTLYCAVHPELKSRKHFYYNSCRPKVSSPESRNKDFQNQLWDKTCDNLKDFLTADVFEKYGPNLEEEDRNEEDGDEEEGDEGEGDEAS